MTSDFAGACRHLEEAFRQLGGADETSALARETLAQVIDAVTLAQHSRCGRQADILVFPAKTSGRAPTGRMLARTR